MTAAIDTIKQTETIKLPEKLEIVPVPEEKKEEIKDTTAEMMSILSEGMHCGISVALIRFCSTNNLDLNPSPINANVSEDFMGFLMAEYKNPGPQYVYPFNESIKKLYDNMIAKQMDILCELWLLGEESTVFQIGKMIGQMETAIFLRTHLKETKELVLQIRHIT